MKANKGFTLIELVVVIVILGILAVTALPRFVDLSDQAEQAAVDGLAGAISSGMAVNYAGCAANDFAVGTNCVIVANACSATEAESVLTGTSEDFTNDYTFAEVAAPGGTDAGESATCSITNDDTSAVANYTSIDTQD